MPGADRLREFAAPIFVRDETTLAALGEESAFDQEQREFSLGAKRQNARA